MARITYKSAIQWLVYNDDCHWLDEEDGISTVSVSLVADIYRVSEEKVEKDLRKLWEAYKNDPTL